MPEGWTDEFLSTPSARRATRSSMEKKRHRRISIHALREEGDYRHCRRNGWQKAFLSTPSARRATAAHADNETVFFISIHALREEGDRARRSPPPGHNNFYPRPPRGGRRGRGDPRHPVITFLSTPSARRATVWERLTAPDLLFLSTPSARRATYYHNKQQDNQNDFYPRPPRGGRQILQGIV